ncbi:MAG: molecular chaperone DnaJ [Propionibacteriaceae bacterium]|nr:molecular chaperone DnaJ [Propionibacteriaceae bacterium]
MSTDYYATLGVAKDATPDQIKRAFRKMAMQVHPDVTDDPEAEEKFKAVNEAYEVLSDPQKRAVYDRGGDPTRGGNFDPFGMGNFSGFAQGFDIGNLMDAMFGGGGGAARGPRPRARRGQDRLVRTTLTLYQAAFGTRQDVDVDTYIVCPSCGGQGGAGGTKPEACPQCQGRGEVTQVQRSFLGDIRTTQACPNCQGYGTVIPDPCRECAGEGRVRSVRQVSVKIPQGVSSGNRIHLAGQGETGPGGGPAGDLYVEVTVAPHDVFRREGDNLEMLTRLPMTAAALGTQIELRTLEADGEDTPEEDRTVTLTIPAGTQAGTRLVVKGRGVPKLRGSGRGELGVTLFVQTPTKLTDDQRDLLAKLAVLRDEEHPQVQQLDEHKGFFGRLKDSLGG